MYVQLLVPFPKQPADFSTAMDARTFSYLNHPINTHICV